MNSNKLLKIILFLMMIEVFIHFVEILIDLQLINIH